VLDHHGKRSSLSDWKLFAKCCVFAAMTIAAISGLFVLIGYLLNGCGSDPSLPPPPLEVNGVPIVYKRGYFDGPALAGALTRKDGTPVVLMEPMDYTPPAVQWFIWSHEVCHLEGNNTELSADCCAAQRLDSLGVPMWEPMDHLQNNSHTDSEHPPGAVRAFTFMSCYLGTD
jgi:hypothetical protein